MKRMILLVLFIFLPTLTTTAQCTKPDAEPERCTLLEAYTIYRAEALKTAGLNSAVKATDKEVTNTNRATTPPDAFAGRVHNSYQDFLNLFSFAINKVDESSDGQAITVRFNPLRDGPQLLGFTLTAAKPSIADVVKKALPETGRADLLSKLQEKLNDSDDLTLGASYSLQTAKCTVNSGTCYGRSSSSYRAVIANMVASLLEAPLSQADVDSFNLILSLKTPTTVNGQLLQPVLSKKDIEKANGDLNQINIAKVDEPGGLRERLKLLAAVEAKQTVVTKASFSKKHLEIISTLIDNQPQVAFTGTYRASGKFGGPRQSALNLELQVGTDNINTLKKGCDPARTNVGMTECLENAFAERVAAGGSPNKWVFSATYTRDARYKLVESDLSQSMMVTGFMPIDVKSAYELIVKGQGGRQLSQVVQGKPMRADFSLEGHVVEKDGVRNTNRWLATATLTMPLGDNMSIPVSVTYANKTEFLTDKRKLSAHLGISYRLPMRPANP